MQSLSRHFQFLWLLGFLYAMQGFIQDFQFGGRDVVCGLTGMGEYFPRSCPEMVLKALWFHFADK